MVVEFLQAILVFISSSTSLVDVDYNFGVGFSYLIASMGLQLLWSFGLACLDVYALRGKKDLQNPILVSLFVVGDWVCTLHFYGFATLNSVFLI